MKYLINLIILFCLLCSGCGFKLRSHDQYHMTLTHLYLSTEKPYSPLTTDLCALFQANDVQLVRRKNQAKYSLVITNDLFSYSEPEVVNASLPTTIGFSKTATLTLKNNENHSVIASKTFSATRSLTLNRNQIYTKNANPDIQKSLNNELILFIHYWLVSATKNLTEHHEIKPKTIRHAA